MIYIPLCVYEKCIFEIWNNLPFIWNTLTSAYQRIVCIVLNLLTRSISMSRIVYVFAISSAVANVECQVYVQSVRYACYLLHTILCRECVLYYNMLFEKRV